jgi:hypothetical protein
MTAIRQRVDAWWIDAFYGPPVGVVSACLHGMLIAPTAGAADFAQSRRGCSHSRGGTGVLAAGKGRCQPGLAERVRDDRLLPLDWRGVGVVGSAPD